MGTSGYYGVALSMIRPGRRLCRRVGFSVILRYVAVCPRADLDVPDNQNLAIHRLAFAIGPALGIIRILYEAPPEVSIATAWFCAFLAIASLGETVGGCFETDHFPVGHASHRTRL